MPAVLSAAKPVFICACGITKNFPFCDGSHKGCKGEEPEAVYRYDPETGEPTKVE